MKKKADLVDKATELDISTKLDLKSVARYIIYKLYGSPFYRAEPVNIELDTDKQRVVIRYEIRESVK